MVVAERRKAIVGMTTYDMASFRRNKQCQIFFFHIPK